MPKVSVLMSVFNSNLELLNKALNGLENQSYKNFEVVLVNDDPSNEELKDYLKNSINTFSFPIKKMENDRNMGLIYSLNKGLKACSGDYIARADDDDFSYNNRLEKQVTFLEANKNIVAVGGWVKIVDELGNGSAVRKYPSLNDIPKSIPFRCPIQHSFLMVRRNVMIDVGGYSSEYYLAEDYALFLKLRYMGYKLDNIQEVLGEYKFTVQDSRKRSKKCRKSVFKAKIRFFNKKEFYNSLKGIGFGFTWWVFPQFLINLIYHREIKKPIIY
ncbi:glycosyltransferase [Peribacillus frigoritolerans]|uniref:glycosyltransferase n=1 Tax=Peribacillus frigoritolerans TaxID=450367 RepID=UPI0021D3A87A|nr:glycosyltransferase [Peribacillus frigoritolerans]MCU6600455.1 glycosyltransferase [Peribacillus frigoritolerans]